MVTAFLFLLLSLQICLVDTDCTKPKHPTTTTTKTSSPTTDTPTTPSVPQTIGDWIPCCPTDGQPYTTKLTPIGIGCYVCQEGFDCVSDGCVLKTATNKRSTPTTKTTTNKGNGGGTDNDIIYCCSEEGPNQPFCENCPDGYECLPLDFNPSAKNCFKKTTTPSYPTTTITTKTSSPTTETPTTPYVTQIIHDWIPCCPTDGQPYTTKLTPIGIGCYVCQAGFDCVSDGCVLKTITNKRSIPTTKTTTYKGNGGGTDNDGIYCCSEEGGTNTPFCLNCPDGYECLPLDFDPATKICFKKITTPSYPTTTTTPTTTLYAPSCCNDDGPNPVLCEHCPNGDVCLTIHHNHIFKICVNTVSPPIVETTETTASTAKIPCCYHTPYEKGCYTCPRPLKCYQGNYCDY